MASAATSYIDYLIKTYKINATSDLSGPRKLEVHACHSSSSGSSTKANDVKATDKVGKEHVNHDDKLANITYKNAEESLLKHLTLCGKSTTYFCVGGEKRLCLPQFLNILLSEFSADDIQATSESLNINFATCNDSQLNTLKKQHVIPVDVSACGLISQTDAQRLLFFLQEKKFGAGPVLSKGHGSSSQAFKVYHECFGKCRGIIYPEKYSDRDALCIECCECGCWMSPERFVCHSHRAQEMKTCHWGFESSSWRKYLLLAQDHRDESRVLHAKFDEIKSRFLDRKLKRNNKEDLDAHQHKRSHVVNNDDEVKVKAKDDDVSVSASISVSTTGMTSILYKLVKGENSPRSTATTTSIGNSQPSAAISAAASEDNEVEVQGRVAELLHQVCEGSLSLAGRQQAVCKVLELFDKQQATIKALQQEQQSLTGELQTALAQVERYKQLECAQNLACLSATHQ